MNILSFTILLLIGTAQAEETKVYVMGPDASLQAYKAQLEVEPQSKSFIDQYLTTRPQWSKVQKLQQAFEAAQKSYLSEPLKEATKLFMKVADLRFEEDWDQPQIEMIHYALLRLAQHDSQGEKWMQEAIRWNPDLDPNNELFPPQFILDHKSTKQKLKMKTWDLSTFKQNGETFIVNGQWMNAEDFIMRPEGLYRLTVVSNRYLPLTTQGSIDDLVAKIQGRQLFIRGQCNQPDWNSQTQGQNLKAFFSPECQVTLRENKKKDLDLAPSSSLALDQSLMTERMPAPRTGSLFQSKWFWIGTAVVVGFVAYSQMQPKDKGSEPSTHEGF